MEPWWITPLREEFDGRRVVLAGAVAAAWTEHIELLRSVGVGEILVIATEGRGTGPQPDVPTLVVEPPPGLPMIESIRFGNDVLAHPTQEMRAALDDFDPGSTALAVGTFLNTAPSLDGRPFLAYRRPEWEALEDKVVVDAFWDRAGVDRQPSIVVERQVAREAAASLDRGQGTVWAADARDGFNGGGSGTFWVADEESADRAETELAPMCDRVRVMPFLDGIPCSLHGIVLPDGIIALRPVEMIVLRSGTRFVYAGCATYWDPPTTVREQMRNIVRQAGAQLAADVDFRGTFTVDGVVTDSGFWPTELNPRFGAGIMTIARASHLPILMLNDLIVSGRSLGRSAAEIETDLLAAADEHRGGGTWRGGFEPTSEMVDRPICRTASGGWRWAGDGESPDGLVTAGNRSRRCTYDPATTPRGPSTGPLAAGFWEFADRELGTDLGALTAAPDPGAGVTTRI